MKVFKFTSYYLAGILGILLGVFLESSKAV